MQLTATLFDKESLNDEQKELFANFEVIAENLDTTLEHLNEIITLQTNAIELTQTLKVADFVNQVKSTLQHQLLQSKAIIYTEFSEVEEIEYVPAYFESILHNLITNAVKYRSPQRDPEI